jgi:hypothetical protein
MKAPGKIPVVLSSLTAVFIGLVAAFWFDLWGRPLQPVSLAAVDPKFTDTAPVRLSAAELIRSGGDASGLDCYACHEQNKQVQLRLDTNGNIVLPKEHEDLVMRHGRYGRNENCFNCHDPEKLDALKTRDGKRYEWKESTKLCASCHGPSYRDWEAGIHGRTSGYWDRAAGPIARLECTSCHHPHSPAFPSLNPAPRPHALHPKNVSEGEKAH